MEGNVYYTEARLKALVKKYWILFTVATVLIALDQWTKHLVRTTIPYGGSWMPLEWLAPYFRFVHWTNTGVAFGMFQGFGYVFTILALIVAGAIIYYYPQIPEREWLMRVALGMQLGGALGNFIDRIFFNFQVTDFISMGNFAVYNIADASISVGVAILLICVWSKDQKSKLEEVQVDALDDSEEILDESQNRDN